MAKKGWLSHVAKAMMIILTNYGKDDYPNWLW